MAGIAATAKVRAVNLFLAIRAQSWGSDTQGRPPRARIGIERHKMERNILALSLGLALGLAGLILLPGLGRASPGQCAAHDQIEAELAKQFSEAPHAMGLAQDDTVMELYASPAGTWTLTVTLPSGLTCLVAAGAAFESIAPTQAAKGDPT